MRICSFLPSATEMVYALGMEHALVGVSHECDYPAAAAHLPKITWTNLSPDLTSAEIEIAVTSALESGALLYDLNVELLESLAPDIILTQRLCDVCAISYDRMQEVIASLSSQPTIVNLEPHSLQDILDNIRTVAQALEREEAGAHLIMKLEARIQAIRRKTQDASRPRVFCMEWVDPPYCGGHWMHELVDIAGGVDALSNKHRPSYRIEWDAILDFAPEVIVLTCCGYSLSRCIEEAALLHQVEGFLALPAVRNGRVYATNGSAFFARPGPRIVDSLEILAHLIHPELFASPAMPQAWAQVDFAGKRAVA
jgi:iron complex transport system substrate-binding protein